MMKSSVATVLLALMSTMAQAEILTFRAELNGHNEYNATTDTLDAGDMDGYGAAIVRIDSDTDMISWSLDFHNLSTLTSAHIHTGMFGQNGPVLIALTLPAGMSGHGSASGTVADFPNALDVISSAPANFYVNVHALDFPAGAIRGQLAAVPEAETWALMGLGLGGVFMARRRAIRFA